MTAVIAAEVHEGVGVYHSQAEAIAIAKLVVVNNVLWVLIVNITKASILTQYLRIFCSTTTRTLCYTLLAALLPAASYATFGGIFLCSPTAKVWNPALSGTCHSAQIYWLSVAGLDIGLDFLVLLLPLPTILALRLPARQKAIVVLLFALGFLICVVAVGRLVSVYLAAKAGNYVESGVWAIVWSAVEANVGIMCASLLALKPLVAKLWPRLFERRSLPERCLRIAVVNTSGAKWSASPRPYTPSTGLSKEVLAVKRWSAAKIWAPIRGHSVYGQSAPMHDEVPRAESVSGDEGERLDFREMLQRPEEVAHRAR